MYSDWLVHAAPLRLWLAARTHVPVLGWFLKTEMAPFFFSWAGCLFDTCIVWLMLSKRLRPYAYAVILFFHAVTRMLFPIGMFPFIMVTSALVFFSPSWPRILLRKPLVLDFPRASSSVSRTQVCVAGVFVLIQFLVPLRFAYYGGDVRWHEQGMRFSWRVMVREKNGSVTFNVTQPSTQRQWYVSPHAYLNKIQEREMSTQPDLILQLAHRIGRDQTKLLGEQVQVRVDAWVSLNGRPKARLIDPSVNLMAVKDGLGKAAWILPVPKEPPPHVVALK
jgi:hypothetical protein